MNEDLARACFRACQAGWRYHRQVREATDHLEQCLVSGDCPQLEFDLGRLWENWVELTEHAMRLHQVNQISNPN